MSQFDDIDQEFRLLRLRERLQKTAGMWGDFKRHLVGGLATGTAAAGLAAAGTAAAYGLGKLKDTIVKGRAMKDMIEANPHLAKKDAKQVKMTFNSLYHLNPDLATDPLVSGSFVARSIDRVEQGDSSGAYIDPTTAIQLAKGQSGHMDPVLQAFVQAGSSYKPDKPERPTESLADKAKLKQYERQLQEHGGGHEFGAAPPTKASAEATPSPRQQAEAAFQKGGKK